MDANENLLVPLGPSDASVEVSLVPVVSSEVSVLRR